MKKIYILVFALALASSACKKSDLQLGNPNNPSLVSLETKTGIEYYSAGFYRQSGAVFDKSTFYNSVMGDEQFSSVGNFGMRFTQQVTAITLPAPYNTKIPNIFGVDQITQLRSLNNFAADASGSNAFQFTWQDAYLANGQANILLMALDNPKLEIPASEKATLQAWAYWWKGLLYSQIGSLYSQGIINNAADGTTNNNYVGHDAIIAEANANFEKAIALLKGINDADADYKATMVAITPSFNVTGTAITPSMWVRSCYTNEARNILVNTKVKDLNAAILTKVSDLASKGLVQGDQAFVRGMDVNSVNDLTAGTQIHPFLWNNDDINPSWQYTSERLVQDFKVGDKRKDNGIRLLGTTVVNVRARGIQFGSRYTPNAIEDGGYWTTGKAHVGKHLYAGSWEENALMLAEVQIRSGNIETGLGYIDDVRIAQGAQLAAVKGTGLDLNGALEELRKERRIGLFLRGVAFYDARRWGVTAPASQGGGRAGAIVLVPGSFTGGGAGYTALPCFIEYNYADYWDVPIDETAYNAQTTKATAQ
ncbi:MAG: RagB/SusD family nutrient uptake outer membrane protein [Mucilaginibacter sp.]|nr:RagB/SusD family nutrient uptake outer membrane protein [Mucilaginibacter sp.]